MNGSLPGPEEMRSHLNSLEPTERGAVFLLLWLKAVVAVAGQLGCAVGAAVIARRVWRERGLPSAVRMVRPTRLGVAVLGLLAYQLGARLAVRRWFATSMRRRAT